MSCAFSARKSHTHALAFSKLKRLLRAAAERAVDGLWARIGRVLDEFNPAECRNYIRHAGYTATLI